MRKVRCWLGWLIDETWLVVQSAVPGVDDLDQQLEAWERRPWKRR